MTDEYRPDWQGDIAEPITEPAYAYVSPPATDTSVGFDSSAGLDTTVVYEPATIVETSTPDMGSDGQDQGKAGAAKEQAAAVGQGAAQAGQQVATVAKDQAQNVVAEAGSQAKDLLSQAKDEVTEQAGAQQKRLVETLRALGDELESMAHHDGDNGMATDLVRQASTRSHDAAAWLDSREPGHVLSDVQSFARQRPATFLALAAGAGLLAGRLGRGVKDAGSDDASSDATTANTSAPDTATYPSAAGSESFSSPAATSFAPEYLDQPAVEDRPFASSQDAGYPYDAGTGS